VHTEKKWQVFISHSSKDTWVARQIAVYVERCGASSFLDEDNTSAGDDFEDEILKAIDASHELVVLLTPWSKTRPYVWLELGAFWASRKRIVGILHGLTSQDISSQEGIPVLLKKMHLLDLNRIDLYFNQLAERVKEWEAQHG
jgi:hypothetical protein